MTIIKKFEPIKKESGFSKKYIIIAAFCIICLVVLEIWVQNSLVLYGEKFEKISNLQDILKLENQILENEIARQSSLSKLASKSAELGFSRLEKIQYIR